MRGTLPIEPERSGGIDLEVDEEFAANVLGVELVEPSIEPTIVSAWFCKARLGDRMVKLQEVESHNIANCCIELIWAIDELAQRSNLDCMCLFSSSGGVCACSL
jgi:hypothetical protein